MKKLVLGATAALIMAQPVLAADNPWFGTWKLNRSKSTLTGTTVKVVKKGNAYHFDYGALKYDIIEDGQDHTTVPEHTAMLKVTGNGEWLTVDKVKGTEVSRATMKLSNNDANLDISSTGTRPDGTTYKDETKVIRVGAGSGLAGTWKSVADNNTERDEMVYSDAGGGKLKIQYVHEKSEVIAPLDGTPTKESGPRVTPIESMTFKRVTPTELKYTVLMSGKPFAEGVQDVSADGKVLKEESWLVSQPTEKMTQVFEKQ